MWTLESALPVCRQIEDIVSRFNAHCALGGSVLHKGTSDKDLDIFIYSHSVKNKYNTQEIISRLILIGFIFHPKTKTKEKEYEKDVQITDFAGERVDIFFL